MTLLRATAFAVFCIFVFMLWRTFDRIKTATSGMSVPSSQTRVVEGSTQKVPSRRPSKPDAVDHPQNRNSATGESTEPPVGHENDSAKTLGELAKLYAVADLAKVFSQSRPLTELGAVKAFLNTQRTLRIKAKDGRGTLLRFSIITDLGGGVIQPVSCASVQRSQEPLQVGILGEGSLSLRELPEKYAYLLEIRQTYVVLLLGEWSEARWERNQVNPDVVYLYKRDGDKIRYEGVGAGNVETAMLDAAPEFCRRESMPTD